MDGWRLLWDELGPIKRKRRIFSIFRVYFIGIGGGQGLSRLETLFYLSNCQSIHI